jgi:hypothetical protein
MEPLLCSMWARLAQLPGADTGFVDQAKQSFACSTP